MKINAQFNNWINRNPLSVEHLALFRILFATFYLFTFGGIYRFDWMASFPSFFYNPPPSFGSLFDSFPNVYFLHGVNLVLPVLAIFVLMGYKTRYTSLLFGLLLIVNSSFLNSFGKISHSHLVPFTALIFAFSGWGAKFSFDEFLNKRKLHIKKRDFNVVPFYALIISFAFFTSGFSKLIGGWLDINYQATRYLMCANAEFLDRYNLLTSFFIEQVHSRIIWEIIDWTIVTIEIAPLLLLFYPKYFRISMFLIATFHVGVYFLLNISFGFYPLLYLVFIIRWSDSSTIRRMCEIGEKYNIANYKKFYILLALLIYTIYIFILYGVDLKAEEGQSINLLISLFISYLLAFYFFCEPLFKKKGNSDKQL